MDLKLDKLPWYGQVGLFVALGLALIGGFYWFYAVPTQAEMATRQQKLDGASRHHRERVCDRESAEPVPPAGRRARSTARKSEGGAAGTEGRRRSVAAHRNAGEAVESRDPGFKPAPSVTKQLHAEWPIALQLDGTYHNLAMFFDRVSKFSRIINVSNIAIRAKEKPQPNSTISVDVRGDNIRSARDRETRGAGREGELTWRQVR